MDHLAFAAHRLSQGNLEAHLAAAGGGIVGAPDWGLGLAPEVASLLAAADEMTGVPQPDLEQHQQAYVRYSSMQEAHRRGEWRQQDSLLAEATSSFGDPSMVRQVNSAYPVAVSMRLVHAPAAFARPMVQRKLFRPSFKVRLEIRYRGRLSLPVRVDVATMVDAQLAKPSTWRPDQNPAQAEIENTRIIRHIQVPAHGEPELDPTLERTHAETFDFADLRFIKSSRMSKRWLVFALRIKDDLLYNIYALPTVIVSRRTDQFAKALETLTGSPVPPPGGERPSGGSGGHGFAAPAAKRPRLSPYGVSSPPLPAAPSPGLALLGAGGSGSGVHGAGGSMHGGSMHGGSFGASFGAGSLAGHLGSSSASGFQLPVSPGSLTAFAHQQQQQQQQQQTAHLPPQQPQTPADFAQEPQPPPQPQPPSPPRRQAALDITDSEAEDADGQPKRPTSPVTADTIVGWVHRKYAAAGLTRRLTSADMAALEAAAGLPAARHGGGCVAAADDWLAFKDWFMRTMHLLAGARQLWEATSPAAIAGFAVTRDAAEAALAAQPPGAFLLRLADEPGCLAISAHVERTDGARGSPTVEHQLLDGAALAERRLEAAVLAAPQAVALLDIASNCLTPKEAVFGGESARPAPAANGDVNRMLSQAGGSHLPGLFGASRPQQLGPGGGGGGSRDVLGGETPSRGAFNPPEASAPGGDSPVVRPWPRLGTGAFVNSPLGGGGRGSAQDLRGELPQGGPAALLNQRLASSSSDAPVFEPLHLQATLRQHAQAQLEAAQQGYNAEAAAQRQLEVAQLEAALLAQQHRQRQLQGFRHSGDSAAAADPAEQPHTQHQASPPVRGDSGWLASQAAPGRKRLPPIPASAAAEDPSRRSSFNFLESRPAAASPPRSAPMGLRGGSADSFSPSGRTKMHKPLARRLQAVVVPSCFCDADAPPGFQGRCC